MTQVTVRQINESWVAKAKALAAERQVSMNTVLKEAIRTGLGLDTSVKTNDLEIFANTWKPSPEEDAFWEKYLDHELQEIRPEDWS